MLKDKSISVPFTIDTTTDIISIAIDNKVKSNLLFKRDRLGDDDDDDDII